MDGVPIFAFKYSDIFPLNVIEVLSESNWKLMLPFVVEDAVFSLDICLVYF